MVYWVPSIAPSGMIIYDQDLFKNWKGDILMSNLAGQHIRRLDMDNGKVIGQETLLSDMQTRFRNIATAPDGSIWVLTDEPDGKIIKITPQ